MNIADMVYQAGVERYLEKRAGVVSNLVSGAGHSSPIWHDVAEVGGLAALAAPTVSSMAGKEWSKSNKNLAEVGGLGVLAAPSIGNIVKRMKVK